MNNVRVTICLSALAAIAGCAEPPPPVSVAEFMENPRLLEATMVRCGRNRAEMKYESECVNAREAVNRLERRAERDRRERLEAQSERKRQALRRTQEAAAAARRRAEEERRRREEQEYLGIFDDSGAASAAPVADTVPTGNVPAAVPEPVPAEPTAQPAETAPAAAPPPGTGDLNSVREELRRRSTEN